MDEKSERLHECIQELEAAHKTCYEQMSEVSQMMVNNEISKHFDTLLGGVSSDNGTFCMEDELRFEGEQLVEDIRLFMQSKQFDDEVKQADRKLLKERLRELRSMLNAAKNRC